MKYFNILIKPASSKCNLRCKYCFYYDVASHRNIKDYGIMSDDTMKKIIDRVFDYFDEETTITFSFQGGEPTVAGISYFEKFIEYVNSRRKEYHIINYAIQTNGYLIDKKWAKLFKDNSFLVGVSLDGFKENHDSVRVDNNLKGTFDRVFKSIELLKKYKVDLNILTVLTNQLSKKAEELFEFYLKNDLKVIQLIPCLEDFDSESQYSLKPENFYKFYDKLFPLWFEKLKKGEYISFNYFDNLITLFMGKMPFQCGSLGFCAMQFVTEASGNVYPCDFYCLDQYCVGNFEKDSITDLLKSDRLKMFLKEEKRMCSLCKSCKFKGICNGQCKRMNQAYFNEDYCALYSFMSKYEKELTYIAQFYQNN